MVDTQEVVALLGRGNGCPSRETLAKSSVLLSTMKIDFVEPFC